MFGQRRGPQDVLRGQLRELEKCMVQSMTSSFPHEVWAACEIPHPDVEGDRGITDSKSRAAVGDTVTDKPRRFVVSCEQVQDEPRQARMLQEERALGSLAMQTGWSILDVEEVRDIFYRHAGSGTVNVNDPALKSMLADVYSGFSAEDVQALERLWRLCRRRRKTGDHFSAQGDRGTSLRRVLCGSRSMASRAKGAESLQTMLATPLQWQEVD